SFKEIFHSGTDDYYLHHGTATSIEYCYATIKRTEDGAVDTVDLDRDPRNYVSQSSPSQYAIDSVKINTESFPTDAVTHDFILTFTAASGALNKVEDTEVSPHTYTYTIAPSSGYEYTYTESTKTVTTYFNGSYYNPADTKTLEVGYNVQKYDDVAGLNGWVLEWNDPDWQIKFYDDVGSAETAPAGTDIIEILYEALMVV
ncbi:unnamed protein product, partial [marine sediment metagenome]